LEDFNEFATPTMGSAESYYWDIILNNKEFYQFLITLDQRTNLFKDIGPFGIMAQDKIKPYIRNKALLTLDGKKFLYSWRYESKLFEKITDPLQKSILLEEYEGLQKDIQQCSWKETSFQEICSSCSSYIFF